MPGEEEVAGDGTPSHWPSPSAPDPDDARARDPSADGPWEAVRPHAAIRHGHADGGWSVLSQLELSHQVAVGDRRSDIRNAVYQLDPGRIFPSGSGSTPRPSARFWGSEQSEGRLTALIRLMTHR